MRFEHEVLQYTIHLFSQTGFFDDDDWWAYAALVQEACVQIPLLKFKVIRKLED